MSVEEADQLAITSLVAEQQREEKARAERLKEQAQRNQENYDAGITPGHVREW